MPFTEQDKVILADVVKGLSLAIVRVCKTLEHQQKMDLLEFGREIDLELSEQGTDPTNTNTTKHSHEYPESNKGATTDRFDSYSITVHGMCRTKNFNVNSRLHTLRKATSLC
jgi:hypothetical protein